MKGNSMNQNGVLLELKNICKRYDSVEGEEPHSILQSISLTIEAGRSLAITGASGSGKSTLLNIMGALDQPTQGKVLFQKTDLSQCDQKQLAEIRSSKIGFVFQSHHLLPQCSALENVLIPTLSPVIKTPPRESEARARTLLERVGLAERLTHRPGLLSGGERQRVAVVRALINRPVLLLADEPTGSLDNNSSENLFDLLLELNREEGSTLVVVTHALDLARRLECVYELIGGQLEEVGS
jgi:ABC-type lipoprotein export system ATPase subunit